MRLINESSSEPGKPRIGIFAKIPNEIAYLYPEKEEDISPAHITMVHSIIPRPKWTTDEFMGKIADCVDTMESIPVHINGVGEFIHDNKVVVFSKIGNELELCLWREDLKNMLLANGMDVDDTYPIFKPHITIKYLYDEEASEYVSGRHPLNKINIQKSFVMNEVYLWGKDMSIEASAMTGPNRGFIQSLIINNLPRSR
jgi:2'-5' RNA ligase